MPKTHKILLASFDRQKDEPFFFTVFFAKARSQPLSARPRFVR